MLKKSTFQNLTRRMLVLSLLLACLQGTAQYLKTDGQRIVDANGNEVIFRGIGLGGWMLQEGYMLRTSGPQHTIESRIETLVGAERKAEFYEAWLANHMRKIDVDSMAAWGYNMIRVPMHYKLFTPPIEEEPVAGQITWKDKGFVMLDSLLAWCKANDMYLILDMHAAPGGQGENADISDYDRTKPSLWESTANQDKLVALWRKLAERYADDETIAAYDLINEPNWGFQNHANDLNGCSEQENTLLWNLQIRITEAIREVDANHIIVIEGNCWGNNYNGLPTLWDPNIVISYHKYWNGNDQGAIQGMLNMRSSRNVPIWLGETGENSNTWFTDCISLLEGNGIGWAWWPLKKMGMNNPLQVEVTPGYQQILDFWNGTGARPSEDAAYATLMDLTEKLKLENNIYHPDVVDAKIRQPHSNETVPFKHHLIGKVEGSIVHATDFDMGRHGFAYQDKEVTNITGNAGGQAWNLGYSYRNDGVDIQESSDSDGHSNGYNVGWTENGEWMLYTVQVDSSAAYKLSIRHSGPNAGKIRLQLDGTDLTPILDLPATAGYNTWGTLDVENVVLYEGTHKLKVLIEKGGKNLGYYGFFLSNQLSDLDYEPVSAETGADGRTIRLHLNLKAAGEPTESREDFSVSVDGDALVPNAVGLWEGSLQTLILHLDTTLHDGHVVKVSYSGDDLQSAEGRKLQSFSDLAVQNTLPRHQIVPGKIEAESFFYNQGLVLETTEDTGGGQNLGYTSIGDYADYRINVEQAGSYKLEVRIACESNAGRLRFEQRSSTGTVLSFAEIDVPVTGGWQTWQTVSARINLNAGRSVLRMRIQDPEFNINWFRMSEPQQIVASSEEEASLLIYPNPAKEVLRIVWSGAPFVQDNELTISALDGKLMWSGQRLSTDELAAVPVNHLSPGLYLVALRLGGQTLQQKIRISE